MSTTTKHRAINVKTKEISCTCGWKSSNARNLDEAWDQYDEHTMED